MANTYQIIDEKTWKRAMHCMVFRNSVEPVCKNGRIIMPVSVQAHHSFVDGIQIGKFVDALQRYMDSF